MILTKSIEKVAPLCEEKGVKSIIQQVGQLFGLSMAEREKMEKSVLVNLIIQIPFAAGCNNPQRIAQSHLLITYAASHQSCKETFLHNFMDDRTLMSRLERISHFEGGDEEIIKKGMNFLALIMLNDHRIDAEEDLAKGKYNPFNYHVWTYEETVKKILIENESLKKSHLDEVFTVEEILDQFWGF